MQYDMEYSGQFLIILSVHHLRILARSLMLYRIEILDY